MSGAVTPSAEGIATAVVVITAAATIVLLAQLRRTPVKSTSVLPSPREAAVPHEQFRSCASCRRTSCFYARRVVVVVVVVVIFRYSSANGFKKNRV